MSFEEPDIDPRFYNSDTNEPFTLCLVCHAPLRENDEQEYLVERIFRRVPGTDTPEVLFEYAMCMGCAVEFRQRMSAESVTNMENFLNEKLQNRTGLHTGPGHDPLACCMVTGKEISQCTEFSFHAYCRGNKMLKSFYPFAISDEAMDQMSSLLSAKTMDELDDFMGQYFTGPPEVSKLINPKRLIPI